MKCIFKGIFYLFGSALFLTFTILFGINAAEQFNYVPAFTVSYYLFYIFCLAFITILFLYKGLNCLINFNTLQTKFQNRKQSKEQTKAARAEANKQARIEQLENELNELKKD